ncbi:hypothetical protein BY458DRAFT_491081 [Sporodiniella umbellata]|nr:hypothetical protein BY458DRAFT_491081 [Sporodiniella umbellata]
MRQAVRTTGNNLVGLWRPSFVKADERLFVFGGGGNVTNHLHILDLNRMKWEMAQNVKGTPPRERYGHTATLWNNCIIIFGGCDAAQDYYNDVHIYDITTSSWHQPNIVENVPARYLHSALVFDNKLFIYGGFAKNSECTYVLDELSVLDLITFTWTKYHGIPPRYNHSATLIGHKMYIYAGKDEQGNTVSDLFSLNLNTPPYTPHLVLSGSRQMVLLKSQHFCEAICGKLVVFGRYLADQTKNENVYGLWMLDLDTLEWQKQESHSIFDMGGWNYFTIITQKASDQVKMHDLLFLGNTDQHRPQGYDHFRDALVIQSESLGLYDIPPPQFSLEFSKFLNNPELSDFIIVPSNGQEIHVHQVILVTRWPHFNNMCRSGMVETQQGRLSVPESYEVVMAFLKYLYNDGLEDNESCEILCDLLILANMYLLTKLKKICCLALYRRYFTIEHCGAIFEKAIMAEEAGLRQLVLDFMFKNYGTVLKSNVLMHMPPFVRLQFLDAVPEEAVLEVHQRSHSTQLIYKSAAATPVHLSTNRHTMKFNTENRLYQRESLGRLLRSHDSEETLVS